MARLGLGKDTFCNYIQNIENSIIKIAFADPIKQIAQIMYPDLPKHFLYGDSKYRNEIIPNSFKDNDPLKVRDLLRDIGTNGRTYNEEIWINALSIKVNQNNCSTIVSDVRFINEFNCLKKLKFYLIKIKRNIIGATEHQSETEQDLIKDEDFDFIINNDERIRIFRKEGY